jgi:trk system potassium uptake protein
MQFLAIVRILGILLALFSVTMIPPMAIAWYFKDGGGVAFTLSAICSLLLGLILIINGKKLEKDLKVRDGFLIVVLFWTVLSLFGSLPFVWSAQQDISIADAVFESFSGLTTTGATVLQNLDDMPRALLFYRQQLQWLGGMGIIVLAVAILPMLGIGGMQLYRAETPGPIKDSKLTPRIASTAKALWYLYFGLTVACALAYWAAGMSFFDAVSHSFSTIAIGGFSTHDASIGFFNSVQIEAICMVFMTIAGVNFSLHFVAFSRLQVSHYWADIEFRTYIMLYGSLAVFVCAVLYLTNQYEVSDAIRYGLFQLISIATTAGFATTNFNEWPSILPLILILSSFVGGCAGSTGGGMKVMRIILLAKQGMREVQRLIHPNAVFVIKIGKHKLPSRVIEAVWGFFAAYVGFFILFLMILVADGIDQVTAFSAVVACMNNLGPGLNEVAAHYGNLSDLSKWVLCFAMLLGRLEIFTILVLLTPSFWRR